MSDNKIPLAGVIGSPIGHSKSPKLHNYWLKRLGLNGQYMALDVAQKDLGEVLRTMPKMGFVGANVTIPHKETVLGLVDRVTDRAALIGAANTLVFRADGQIFADNTDGHGFIENLRKGAKGWSAPASKSAANVARAAPPAPNMTAGPADALHPFAPLRRFSMNPCPSVLSANI